MSATTVSRQDHVPCGPAVPRDGVGFGLRFVIATSAGSVLNPVNSSIIAVALASIGRARLRADPPGSVLGALAVAGQATMAVGPPLGGLLIAAGGWRLTFAINLPLAAAGAAFALAWLPKDEPARLRLHALDLPGAVLFAATLTALLLFLMNLRAHPWWLLAVAAAVAVVLAWRELAAGSPFIDVRMLVHNRALTTTYLRFGVTMLVTYCFIYGWTLWLEQAAGKSAATAGLLMIPSFAAAAGVSALAARSRRVWPLLLAGAITLTAGSLSLFVLGSQSPLWMLAAVSVVFGVQNGLSVVTNQAAMYAQAPAAQTGAAAGLLRTFMYLGAIASAGIIGFAFGARASDAGLHQLAVILTAASAVLLAGILLDRDLRHRVMTTASAQQHPATRHRAAAARAQRR